MHALKLLQQNPLVLNWMYRLIQVDLYNSHKTVVVVSCLVTLQMKLLLHFVWGIAKVKCILVTAICVCVRVCPALHSHTAARTRM